MIFEIKIHLFLNTYGAFNDGSVTIFSTKDCVNPRSVTFVRVLGSIEKNERNKRAMRRHDRYPIQSRYSSSD